MTNVLRRLRHWLRRPQHDRELAEELQLHHDMKVAELEAGGLSHHDAELAARRAMGASALAREEAREMWSWPWLESVWQDAAYAFRALRRQPGFAIVSLVVLATAIGLNTSLFTVFNAVALRPWPWAIREPDRVVNVFAQGKRRVGGLSLAEARYLDTHAKTLDGVIAMRQDEVQLGSDMKRGSAVFVSPRYFGVFGVDFERGRGFVADEERFDSPQAVAVIAEGVWRTQFGADDRIVGRQLFINQVPFTIVGVAARAFVGASGGREDVWVPFATLPLVQPGDAQALRVIRNPDYCCASVAGRLAPGVAREQARAELEVLSAQFRRQFALEPGGIVVTGTAFLSNPGRKQKILLAFTLMFLGVTLVLLMTCANIGNLLLARAAARMREIGVRLSLGASRARLVRQLLTESLVLALMGGGLGILLAYELPAVIIGLTGESLTFDLTPDRTVLAYTLGLAGATSLLFGLAPALHATRGNVAGALKVAEPLLPYRLSLRSVLLGTQVAFSVVLLSSAGLLVRGIQHARAQDPGFAIDDVSVARFELPINAYDPPRTKSFLEEVAQRVRDTPGVHAYAFAAREPLASSRAFTSFSLPGEPEDQARTMMVLDVSPGYVDVLRLPVVRGRAFAASDAADKVAMVNETLAHGQWPNLSAVGQTFVAGGKLLTIIGVVQDAYTMGLDRVEPMFYRVATGSAGSTLLVRGSSGEVRNAIAPLVAGIDPRVRVTTAPLAESVDRYLTAPRVGALIATMLGVFAVLLAAIGMFGVFAYVVQQRTREIGVRMALGAQPGDVIRLVLGGNVRAVTAGLAAGLLGAAAGSQLLRGSLYGLSPFDPWAYAGVGAVLAAAGLAASYVPARRATRIDPMTALRAE